MTGSGRILPHDLDAEKSVLGAVIVTRQSTRRGCVGARGRRFLPPGPRCDLQAAVDLDQASQPVDPVSLADRMRAADTTRNLRQQGGESYFAELTAVVVTVENVAHHAHIVRDKATVRRMIEAAQEVVGRGYGNYGDFAEFIADAEREILAVSSRQLRRSEPALLRASLSSTISAIRAAERARCVHHRIPTGLARLDEITCGWQDADLVVIAGRPSMGKTALAVGSCAHAASSTRYRPCSSASRCPGRR